MTRRGLSWKKKNKKKQSHPAVTTLLLLLKLNLLVFSPFLSSAWCCVSAAIPEYETRYSLHTRQPVAAVCVGVAEIELGGAGLT
jgi:hypothetical protein